MTPKDRAIDEAQKIANQLSAKQRAVAAVLSALEEAEVQRMPVATLRAIKQGRPFKVKPTGITAKGFAGFKINDSAKLYVGKRLHDSGWPRKIVQNFIDGFDKSIRECEGGFYDEITLCLTRDGELFQFNGLRSLPKSREELALLFRRSEKNYFLKLWEMVDEILERRMAFLERRPYQEPESIREYREKNSTGHQIIDLLSDPTLHPRSYMPPLEKIFGRKVTLDECQWLFFEDGIYHFQHKASGRYFGFDHAGNYYRYDDGKYVPAEFDLEEVEHEAMNPNKQ